MGGSVPERRSQEYRTRYLNYLIHAQLPDTGWIRFDGVFSPEGRIVLRHLKQQERAY